jgi:hypothetical protein
VHAKQNDDRGFTFRFISHRLGQDQSKSFACQGQVIKVIASLSVGDRVVASFPFPPRALAPFSFSGLTGKRSNFLLQAKQDSAKVVDG